MIMLHFSTIITWYIIQLVINHIISSFPTVAYIDDPCTSRSQCDAGVAYSWCSVEGLCECGNNEEVFETEERSYCYKSRADEFCFYPDECLSEYCMVYTCPSYLILHHIIHNVLIINIS